MFGNGSRPAAMNRYFLNSNLHRNLNPSVENFRIINPLALREERTDFTVR